MSELAVKRIGVDIAVGRLGSRAIGLAVVLGTGKAIDLHKGAQLVLKRNVAGAVGIAALNLGRKTLARRNGARDVFKDLVELGGVGRRLVVVGTGNGVAKIDIPLSSKKAIAYGRCGIRIVARHGMHEFILVARAAACWIVARLRTVEDTDGINGRPAALYGLGDIDGILSNLGLKTTRTCRRAIGEEHDDLLGVFTTRSDALGQVHAIVGTSSASRLDGINRLLEPLCAAARARRQLLHCLREVIGIAVRAIRFVTDAIGLLSCKLYNGDLVLFIRVLNALVLLGNGVDKVVGSILERIDALGGTSAAHRIIHRARGIEHHHDVERLGNQRGRVRCRRHRRKRGRKVGLSILDGLDRLIRPNSADVLCRDLAAIIAARPELPMVAGVVVGYSCCCRSVHTGTGPGVGLGQHGECRGWQH